MANHRLYLNEPCDGQVGKSTKYKYDDGVLELEWQGKSAWYYFPPKSAVIVVCDGAMPDVVPLRYPENYRWKALWMAGVSKKGRCVSCAEFNAKVEADPMVHRISEGNGWKLAWVKTDGREWLAFGWCGGKVSNEDVRAMIDAANVDAPDWFVKEVLGI